MLGDTNQTAKAALQILAQGGDQLSVNICVNGHEIIHSSTFDRAVFDVLLQHPAVAEKSVNWYRWPNTAKAQ